MKIASSNICRMTLAAAAALALQSQAAQADENGVSLWLPGQFGSLAAAPAVTWMVARHSGLSHQRVSFRQRCGGTPNLDRLGAGDGKHQS